MHAYDCHGHGRSEPFEERSRALIWRFYHVVRPHSHTPCHNRLQLLHSHWARGVQGIPSMRILAISPGISDLSYTPG